jgi:hypothetical protein
MNESEQKYRTGDIATVEGRVAVYMPTRWEWMDGTWTTIPLTVGPVLGNVYDVAAHGWNAPDEEPRCLRCGFTEFGCSMAVERMIAEPHEWTPPSNPSGGPDA